MQVIESVYSSDDFAGWMEEMTQKLFGMGREAFLAAYRAGRFPGNLTAKCVASVEDLAAPVSADKG